MLDPLTSSFNQRVVTVMETMLTEAVREITKIFECSLSESQLELTQSRLEIKILRDRLDASERELKSKRTVGDGAGCESSHYVVSKGEDPDAVPVALDNTEAALLDQDGSKDTVKNQVGLKELEPVCFSPEETKEFSIIVNQESIDTKGNWSELLPVTPRKSEEGAKSENLSPLYNGDAEQKLQSIMTEDEERPGLIRPVKALPYTAEWPLHCSHCGKGFSEVNKLRSHERYHHAAAKAFSCKDCGRNFAFSCHLRMHQRIHTGERPYACSQCGKAFIRRNDFNNHTLAHTGERPHACDQCSKRFTIKGQLKRHQLTHLRKKIR